jgi:predicted TIM-barrel enzyme
MSQRPAQPRPGRGTGQRASEGAGPIGTAGHLEPDTARAQILDRLRAKIDRHEPIVGGGAGSGLSAKSEEAGGIDLIVIYNSGRFRMAGRGSLAGLLAYGNANDIVLEMGTEVLPAVQMTPVLAGVNGTDPFYNPRSFLTGLLRRGFAGVQNFPTVGLIDGTFRANLEETGMGYRLEIEMIGLAHDLDLLTTPYIFSADDAAAMTGAGADLVVCHMGLTTGGTIGAGTALTLDDCVRRATEWAEAARAVREDVIVLVHGGPIAEPADAAYVLQRAEGINGFYGASSMERLPVEQAITERTRAFTRIRTVSGRSDEV